MENFREKSYLARRVFIAKNLRENGELTKEQYDAVIDRIMQDAVNSYNALSKAQKEARILPFKLLVEKVISRDLSIRWEDLTVIKENLDITIKNYQEVMRDAAIATSSKKSGDLYDLVELSHQADVHYANFYNYAITFDEERKEKLLPRDSYVVGMRESRNKVLELSKKYNENRLSSSENTN